MADEKVTNLEVTKPGRRIELRYERPTCDQMSSLSQSATSSSRDHNTCMPPAGERPDNLSLAADAQNSTVFGEQHRVTRALS